MAFADIVAKLNEGVENIGDVAAFAQELQEEHAKELSVRDTKISSLGEDLTKVGNELKETKLTNYDLIMRSPAKGGNGDSDTPATTKTTGSAGMFKRKDA